MKSPVMPFIYLLGSAVVAGFIGSLVTTCHMLNAGKAKCIEPRPYEATSSRTKVVSCIPVKNQAESLEVTPLFIGSTEALEPRKRLVLEKATSDFNEAIRGKPPKFAKIDERDPMLTDGGTLTYRGDGYLITVLRSMATLGGINGYFYGPILVFNSEVAIGNSRTVSNVRFYSTSALRKLTEK